MISIILTRGIPGSGKSTWAKAEVAKDPNNWFRINNDELRNMANSTVFSPDYEKLITKIRCDMIVAALKQNKNVIVDNVNASDIHFEEVCKISKNVNVDVKISEKIFYIDLDEAIERDSRRQGKEQVGEQVIRKFWNKFGREKFKDYQPKEIIFQKRINCTENIVKPMEQDENLPKCGIIDLDGTMCDISHRNPYDASTCDQDLPNKNVVELAKLLYENGYKIFFFSGREEKYRDKSEFWLNKHFEYPYELYMRETKNFENDADLKERLFNTHIKDKYNCKIWIDDRLKVSIRVFELGLPLFRFGHPLNNF